MKEFNVKATEEELLVTDDNLKGYINELVKELRDDIEVYEQIKPLGLTLGEVKQNIAKLADFKDDYNYCKNCPGIDKCDKQIPHVRMTLRKEGNYIAVNHETCERILEKIRVDSKYLRSDFPEEWKGSTLRTLDLSENRKAAIKEFNKIVKGTSSRWLYAYGNHKIGKSFMMVTFANEFAAMNKGQVAVCDCATYIGELADLLYKDKTEFQRQMVNAAKVPLLVLDNFGSEYKNEVIRDQIVIPLLSEREKNGNVTFFTSEFDFADIKEMYTLGKNAGSIRAKQLINILVSACDKEIDMTGVSIYRK